jgi:hypothetical protein
VGRHPTPIRVEHIGVRIMGNLDFERGDIQCSEDSEVLLVMYRASEDVIRKEIVVGWRVGDDVGR